MKDIVLEKWIQMASLFVVNYERGGEVQVEARSVVGEVEVYF